MDVNVLRAAITVLSAVGFVGIWVWAWRRTNAAGFAAAARLPLRDDTHDGDLQRCAAEGLAGQGGRKP